VETMITVMYHGVMTRKPFEQNLLYNPPSDHWLDRAAHPETYQQLKEHFNYYASIEMMKYCTHPHDTQTNEALNQSIANVVPKSVCYSGTSSINSQIAIVVGVHNLGLYPFFDDLFHAAGIQMTTVLARFLHAKQKQKETKQTYKQWLDVKVSWLKPQKKALQEIYKECTDASYGHAVGLSIINNNKQRQESKGDNPQKWCKCGSTEHQRTTHRVCPQNPRKNNIIGCIPGEDVLNNSTVILELENRDSISVTSNGSKLEMVSNMHMSPDS